MNHINPRIPFIIMGITSMLLQITVLRLLLSTFSGNELDIGITLSFWLIYVGLGSFTGKKFISKNAFTLSFLFISILALPTVIAIKAIRSSLSLEPGEVVSLVSIILSTAVTLLPLCFVVGLQFPLAVSFSGEKNAAGKVYGLEALGAFIGGVLFTFVIASRVQTFELCLIISLINILTAAYVSRRIFISLFLLLPVLIYSGFHGLLPAIPYPHMEVLQTVESKYGEINVLKVGDQTSVYASGRLLFSYPDPPTDEISSHLPMTLHPSPAKLLVIGGSPGTMREFLKYPVERIDFIELDPKIISLSRGLLTAPEDINALKDRRLRMVVDDGRRFIKALNGRKYDLIVINLPPPASAGINRFYTTDFFREAKAVLRNAGILFIDIPTSTGYIGRSMQTVNGSIYNSLKNVFGNVGVTAQEYGGLFASDFQLSTDTKTLESRFILRGIQTRHFSPYYFRDAFDPFSTNYVRQRLDEITSVNTDLRPSAYLYNLMLWSEAHGGRGLFILLKIREWHIILAVLFMLLSSSFFIFRKKHTVVCCSIFTTGFSGMTFMLTALLAYQAIYGYIYEMLGVLSASFMIGLWSGAVATKYVKNTFKTLFCLELFTVTLAVASPLFFRVEPLFYVFIYLSGIITGSQFVTANAAWGNNEAAGKLYGIDLAGSFAGALLTAIIVIPVLGLYNAFLLTAALKAFSAVMIRSVRE
jgi:spermidine synthase